MEKIFDLKEIREDLNEVEWEDQCDGTEMRQVFLGTVFSLFPSGKYYTLWANSNVDPCMRCGGIGTIEVEYTKSFEICPACEGIGSSEVLDDKRWHEQADLELESIGCGLTSGEGDPCDLFAAERRDKVTYKIVRKHANGLEDLIIATEVPLEEAKEHCSHPESSSRTCIGEEALKYGKECETEWFDCFYEE